MSRRSFPRRGHAGTGRDRRAALLGATLVTAVALAACGGGDPSDPSDGAAEDPTPVVDAATPPPAVAPGKAVPLPPLKARYRADVLVTAPGALATSTVDRLRGLASASTAFRAGTTRLNGNARGLKIAAVDPRTFRAFTAQGTAEAAAVWQALARGEAVVSHEVATARKVTPGGRITLGRAGVSLTRRVGAIATTGLPASQVLVDDATGATLGLPARSGVVLAAGSRTDPVGLASRAKSAAGPQAEIDLLTAPAANPTAFLTGSRAAQAFGAFSYRYFPDGTIQPDASWVRANIVTARVPIFGTVTCHRLMVPQLRGALQDVVDAGLASHLTTYDGCYVPRFIERNPSNSISLHTWGIAIDLDAATNYRGIRGTMHPEIVRIFKSWGFRWGGDWRYTDPMHFELGALLTRPRS